MISGTPNVGARLHHWHAGQNDPIYAVGSCWYAGIPAARADVERCLVALERIQTGRILSARTPDDEELDELVAYVAAKLSE